jgi:hypothetical protein
VTNGGNNIPKLAADIRLNLARLAMLYRTQTTLARRRWLSRGSRLSSLRRWSVRPLLATFNHSWGFPERSGSGRLRRKSLRRAPKSRAGVLEISSQTAAPCVSTFSRSSLSALAEAHLRKIPCVWGPLWKSARKQELIAGGRALFVHSRDKGTPNILPVVFRNNFKGVLGKNNRTKEHTFFCYLLPRRRLDVWFQLKNDIARYPIVIAVRKIESFFGTQRLSQSRQLDRMRSFAPDQRTRGVVSVPGVERVSPLAYSRLVQRQPGHISRIHLRTHPQSLGAFGPAQGVSVHHLDVGGGRFQPQLGFQGLLQLTPPRVSRCLGAKRHQVGPSG